MRALLLASIIVALAACTEPAAPLPSDAASLPDVRTLADATAFEDAATIEDAGVLEDAAPADAGTELADAGGPSGIGDPCGTCTNGQRCDSAFPGGYCTQDCPCPTDATCLFGTCLKACALNADCRFGEDYVCDRHLACTSADALIPGQRADETACYTTAPGPHQLAPLARRKHHLRILLRQAVSPPWPPSDRPCARIAVRHLPRRAVAGARRGSDPKIR